MLFRRVAQVVAPALCVLALVVMSGCASQSKVATAKGSGAGPAIIWASDPVKAGQTAMIIGDGLDAVKRIQVAGHAAKPMQQNERSVKFTLPNGVAPGVCAVRLISDAGVSVAMLNRPTVLWAQGDSGPTATPGGFVRVFGRCMAVGTHKPTVELRDAAGHATKLTLTRTEPWTLIAKVPANVQPGDYTLAVHNGTGGSAGYSQPIDFVVESSKAWPTTVLNIRDFGATGDGMRDDSYAFKQALDKAAEMGGAIVYLPRGRYKLTEPIVMPTNTILRGERREWTEVLWPDFKEADQVPQFMVTGGRRWAVENISFYCANYTHFLGVDYKDPEAGDVHVRRIRVRAVMYRGHLKPEQVDERFRKSLKLSTGGGDTIRLAGDNLEVVDSDLYGSGRSIFLYRPHGAMITGNDFYNGRWGWYCISGADGVVFENNTLTGGDLMSTGGGINCLYGVPWSQNVYYAHNTLKLMHGWDREAMTSDAGGGTYAGAVASADAQSITVADDPNWSRKDWTGSAVFVLDGKGMGQYRRIVKYDGRKVELDEPWTVVPDSTSIVTITMLQRNYMFIDNSFADASVAMQYYGVSIGNIAVGNRSARTAGFKSMALNYHGMQPSWYCQWIGNEILEGNFYQGGSNQSTLAAEAELVVLAHPRRGDWQWPMSLGTVVRGNKLHSNAHITIGSRDAAGPDGKTPTFTRDVVVEQNHVANADRGVWVHRDTAGVLVQNNTFDNVTETYRDEAAIARQQAAAWAKMMKGTGPIAVWNFDRKDPNAADDAAGNGFDAMPDGKIAYTDEAPSGSAVVLDGSTGLRVDRGRMINMPNWTATAWIKPARVDGRFGIVSKRTGNQAAPFIIAVSEKRLTFEATDAQGKWSFNFASEPVLKPDAWQHVAAVVKHGQGVTLYIDGKPVAHKDNPGDLYQNVQELWIGRDAWGGAPADTGRPGYFPGAIDQVKLWARPLSDAEIAAEAKSAQNP